MPITRNSPVMDMDTEQPLKFLSSTQRFTRAQAHRLLKINNIQHDPGATMEQLVYLMHMNHIAPIAVQPGKLKDTTQKTKETILSLVKNEFPNNVPRLRRMCKDRKIMFKLTDKKKELIQKLNDYYGKNPS